MARTSGKSISPRLAILAIRSGDSSYRNRRHSSATVRLLFWMFKARSRSGDVAMRDLLDMPPPPPRASLGARLRRCAR